MNKELQDLAWAILPKEFKEDVRTIYAATMRMVDKRESAEQIYVNKLSTLEGIFGFDNLTSDAEGKGMLTCEKSKVQRLYAEQSDFRDQKDDCLWKDYEVRDVILMVLQELFGSKCLPDELREKNIASMTVVNDRTRFGYCQVTKITTFDGKTVGVTETPDEIFRKFEQDKKKS